MEEMSEEKKLENSLEKERSPLSPEEKGEWLDGMEEYGAQLEGHIKELEAEIEGGEDTEERRDTEVLIYDLKQEVVGMKEFVETGRDADEELYRTES